MTTLFAALLSGSFTCSSNGPLTEDVDSVEPDVS